MLSLPEDILRFQHLFDSQMTEEQSIRVVGFRDQVISYFQCFFRFRYLESDNLLHIQFSIGFCCHIPRLA